MRPFWFWVHRNCRVIITNKRLVFWDRQNEKYSFEVSIDDLRDAEFDMSYEPTLVIQLKGGSRYEIGFAEKEVKQRLVTQIMSGDREEAAQEPVAEGPVAEGAAEEVKHWQVVLVGLAAFLLLLGLLGGIPIALIIIHYVNPPPRVEQEVLDLVSPACGGRSVEHAAAYTDGPGLHPVVLVQSSGSRHSWTDKVPSEWWPTAVNPPELVACASEEEEEVIEVCPYEGGNSVTRYRYKVDLMLVVAKTGTPLLDPAEFRGPDPRECRKHEKFDLGDSTVELKGSRVPFEEAKAWLGQYVLEENQQD